MKYATFGAGGVLQLRLIEGVHDIPKGAVEVSDDLFKQLGDRTDGVWKIDAAGQITKHPLPVVVPDYAQQERVWRDGELVATEWLTTRHRDEVDLGSVTTLTGERYAELLTYRQALRDWPATGAFPQSAERPTAPPWFAEQVQ